MNGYINLIYGWAKQEIFAIPGRAIAVVFILLLLFAPAILHEPYYFRIICMSFIFSIFAISWDVLSGVTGQLSLGHGLFFGVSGYTAALLNLHLGWSPWLTIPSGSIVAVIFGLLIGIPALRLRGMYLGMVTLVVPIILIGLVHMFSFTGGEMGLSGISGISGSIITTYYVIAFVFLLSAYIMYKLTDAKSKIVRVGIILNAIREDEIAARSSGIFTTRYKFVAFAVSGFFAGLAGALYAHYMRLSGPSVLELFFSFQVILWCTFGSKATIYGPVVGVFILYPTSEILSLFPWTVNLRFLIVALILIISLLFMPEGISIWFIDKMEVKCPRCKLINFRGREKCRACRAILKPKREQKCEIV